MDADRLGGGAVGACWGGQVHGTVLMRPFSPFGAQRAMRGGLRGYARLHTRLVFGGRMGASHNAFQRVCSLQWHGNAAALFGFGADDGPLGACIHRVQRMRCGRCERTPAGGSVCSRAHRSKDRVCWGSVTA